MYVKEILQLTSWQCPELLFRKRDERNKTHCQSGMSPKCKENCVRRIVLDTKASLIYAEIEGFMKRRHYADSSVFPPRPLLRPNILHANSFLSHSNYSPL